MPRCAVALFLWHAACLAAGAPRAPASSTPTRRPHTKPLESVPAGGFTALHEAAWLNQAGVAAQLLADGADPSVASAGGAMALHLAAVADAAHAAEVLLAAGALVDGVDDEKQTALHAAASAGSLDVALLLLSPRL